MLVLDTSALVKRYVDETGTKRVLALMEADSAWCASALAVVETQVTICHLGLIDAVRQERIDALLTDWERFTVVPLDDLCLARAAEIGREQRVRTLDAIHLAAAERLPRPAPFVTFDERQADAGRALGLDVAG
jgi:hypothetical protein